MSYLDGKTPVGFKYEPIKVTWMKRDLLLFANSIGCKKNELQFLYELDPNFQAFPTYPILLPFKHTDQEVINFLQRAGAVALPGIPKVDNKRVLDGQRKMTFYKPLPVTSEGRNFECQQKCIGVYDKGKSGMVLENETLVVDTDSKEVYVKMESSGFAVGQGGWGGPKGPATINYPPPKDKAPTATVLVPTTEEQALLYRLNGDYNPLHASPEFATQNGFQQPILHGLGSWNMTCAALLRTFCNSDPANLKEYQARFSSPVLPGNTLVVEMWKTGKKEGEGFEEVVFRVLVKETGKVVLSNGRAVIKSTGSSKL